MKLKRCGVSGGVVAVLLLGWVQSAWAVSYFFPNESSPAPSTTATASITYLPADVAVGTVRTLFPSVQTVGAGAQPLLSLRGPKSDVDAAKRVIQGLDAPLAQVRLELQVIEVNTTAQGDYRQLLSALSRPLSFNFDVGTGSVAEWPKLQGIIDQMESHGNAKLIAKPQLIALSAQSAHIQIGDRIPYPSIEIQSAQILSRVDYVDTGIFMVLTPTVHNATEVSVALTARLNSVKELREVGQNRVPVLSTREAQTQVRLKNGETLVLAGLLNNSNIEGKTGVPFLMDIPFLGAAFQDRATEQRKTDVIFMITPQILPKT